MFPDNVVGRGLFVVFIFFVIMVASSLPVCISWLIVHLLV